VKEPAPKKVKNRNEKAQNCYGRRLGPVGGTSPPEKLGFGGRKQVPKRGQSTQIQGRYLSQ